MLQVLEDDAAACGLISLARSLGHHRAALAGIDLERRAEEEVAA
jgi:hypothetical protein